MSTLVPRPHVLLVVPAPAAPRHGQLGPRAQPRAVVIAPRQRLVPRRAQQAAAHPTRRAAARAEPAVVRPAQLRAAQRRPALPRRGRRQRRRRGRRRGRRRRRRRRRRRWGRWIAPREVLDTVLGGRRLVDLRARQTSALVCHVGDHELKARPDPDEEVRCVRVSLGRWRAFPVHVAIVLVTASVGVQHDAIERGVDVDIPACCSRWGGRVRGA